MRKRGPIPFHILVFLGPAVLIYTAFMIYPLCASLWLSLNNKGTMVEAILERSAE
jgi:raffinose/stachyose/melibiose transport system permease protein